MTNRIFKRGYPMMDENGTITHTDDLFEWGRFMEKIGDRKVGDDNIGGLHVSTVFLGMYHVSNRMDEDEGAVFLFETMVFGNEEDLRLVASLTPEDTSTIFDKFLSLIGEGSGDVQVRYKTFEEAKEGHQNMVKLVNKALASKN